MLLGRPAAVAAAAARSRGGSTASAVVGQRLAACRQRRQRRQRRRPLSTTSASSLVDWSQAAPSLPRESILMLRDVVTPEEEAKLVQELEPSLRRRRMMANHWDSVIEHYREIEKRDWADEGNAAVVRRIRARIVELLGLPPTLPFLPVHVIDLSADGFIKPHVDSVKFSGGFVAGLSLVSTAIMRLRGEPEVDPSTEGSLVRLLLEPRTLYILRGDARYKYAHEILPPQEEERWGGAAGKEGGRVVTRGRRISLIFRDELLPAK